MILAEGLAAAVGTAVGRTFDAPLARFKGAVLEGVRFRHPLYERDSVAVLGDYVTLDAGTGVVHTAPGHGADDFRTGVKYGLDVYAPIGPAGHFHETVPVLDDKGHMTPQEVQRELHVDVAPLITGRVAIDDVPQAFAALADPDRHAKILVVPGR